MNIQRIAAFAMGTKGGNPAGVVLTEKLPDTTEMQKIAAEVGYSETTFAAPTEEGFRVRYFAPKGEVSFCGHATIALGAALGQAYGPAEYQLTLNNVLISVVAKENGQVGLISPPTSQQKIKPELRQALLSLFGLEERDLEPSMEIIRIHAGADHVLLPLAQHNDLINMDYDFDTGAALFQKFGLATVNLLWRETNRRFHSRNAFAGHGVFEDPATGAAAAAFAGYMRDTGRLRGAFEIFQGQHMGMPSLLHVVSRAQIHSGIQVSGTTRPIV